MAPNSWVWVTEGFITNVILNPLSNWGLNKIYVGYRIRNIKDIGPKSIVFFNQNSGFWQVVSDGKADFKLADPVQARLSQRFSTSGAMKTNRSNAV